MRPRILIAGNVNMDVVLETNKIPQPGENIRCSSLQFLPGGKAANQAVAAARLGAEVTLLASIGDDALSQQALVNLEKEKVNIIYLKKQKATNCGVAVVIVESNGENRILSHSGANEKLSIDDISENIFTNIDIVLVQLGIPRTTVEKVISLAKKNKIPVILDPTPFSNWLPKNWHVADLVIPNETELTAYPELRDHKAMIVKLGAEGCIFYNQGKAEKYPALSNLKVVDTTGAGDAFAGALAVEWVRTQSLQKAIPFAIKVAGIATTKVGAQSAMPYFEEMKNL